jgi:hypothetical protein
MKQKRHSTEEIIRILREVDNGRGMELQDARRYRELEKENRELKTMLADSLLKIRVLEEVNAKKW